MAEEYKMANRCGVNFNFYKYDKDGNYDESTLLYTLDFANEVSISIESGVTYATGGQAHSNMVGFKDPTTGTLTISTQIVTDTLRAIAAGMNIENFHEGDLVRYRNDEESTIPASYIVVGDTVWQDTNGVRHTERIICHKATVSPSLDRSYSGDGDPQSTDIEFELGTNDVGDVYSTLTDPAPEATPVSTSDELLTALAAGESVELSDDISVNVEELAESLTEGCDVTIDVGTNTLTLSGDNEGFNLYDDEVVAFKGEDGGEVAMASTTGTVSCMTVGGTAKVTFEGLDVTCTGSLGIVQDSGTVEFHDCNITCEGNYGMGTNATYPSDGATMLFDSCDLACTDPDSAPILCNTNANVVVKDTTVHGSRQCAFIRCGTCTIENSVLDCVLEDSGTNAANRTKDPSKWTSGNECAYGALILGTAGSSGYKYDTVCTVKNSTIHCSGEGDLADYAYGIYAVGNVGANDDGGLDQTTLNIDSASLEDVGEKIYIAGSDTYEDDNVTTPDGAAVTLNIN